MLDTIQGTKNFIGSFLSWQWTKKLLHWIILSAGTMSDCAFLLASIWMSVNANVHDMILQAMSEGMTKNITYLATTAYVVLPDCILFLAILVVIGHARTFLYSREWIAGLWTIIFGLPTLLFLILALITLGCSVASVTFVMPQGLVVTRALACFWYATFSLLYTKLGEPQEVNRLRQKDTIILELQSENAELHAALTDQKRLLETSKTRNALLEKAVIQSDEDALAGYSQECITWLKSGAKSVMVEEIIRYTGHSKRKIMAAIDKRSLQTTTRGEGRILISSLVSWLKNTPAPSGKPNEEDGAMLHIVNG
jgi:hypothetical protein